MKIKELQEKQQQLDNYIYNKNNVEVEKIYHKKIASLKIELAEMMNEIGAFKYWKKSHIMDEQKVLEEACDCYHFVLSLANCLEVDLSCSTAISMPNDIVKSYLMIDMEINDGLYKEIDVNSLRRIHFMLIDMICQLGYEYSDLIREYNRKYEINIQRQKEGY